MINCLWITRVMPYPPSYGGDMLYSAGLIEALAQRDYAITVLCRAPNGVSVATRPGCAISWRTDAANQQPPWMSLMSRLPSIAFCSASQWLEEALIRALEEHAWDAVVFDNLATGWALKPVQRVTGRRPGRPRLVYISHNHEESLRRSIARDFNGNALKIAGLHIDAAKAGALERDLVDAADLVVANTGADADLYRARSPDKRYLVLTPGYGGRRVGYREITAGLPRRAVIVGSFAWIAKQINLETFIKEGYPWLSRAGVELQVVGAMPDSMRQRMAAVFPTIRTTGAVDDVAPYLSHARLAIVPEVLGGGFKHKLLEFAFNRVPVLAVKRAAEGTPLTANESILEYDDVSALAQGAVSVIDDLSRLNRLQQSAFSACDGRFDWDSRGRALADAIGSLRSEEAQMVP